MSLLLPLHVATFIDVANNEQLTFADPEEFSLIAIQLYCALLFVTVVCF